MTLFTSALQSGQLGPLINQFGLGEEAVLAATFCDMEAFIEVIFILFKYIINFKM